MHPQRGFTLVELLVVIAIIGVLSSIVLASLNTARTNGELGAGKKYASTVDHALGHVAAGVWKLDEAVGGGVAVDDSGNGNTCTIVGGVTSTTGVFGNAFNLDGTTGYLSCGTKSILTLTSKWTIMLWVKPNTYGGTFMTMVSGDGMSDTTGAYNFYIDPDGTMRYETNNQASGTSANKVTAGKWQHLAITFDAAASPNFKYYINGALAGSNNIATAPSTVAGLNIGKRGIGNFYGGAIDEVRIYNEAQTNAQIEAEYRAQLALSGLK